MSAAALHAVPAHPRALAFARGQHVVLLYDALREQRIQALSRLAKQAYAAGHKDETRRLLAEMHAVAGTRSPEQVRRMEDAEMERFPYLRREIEQRRKQQQEEKRHECA